MADIRTLSASKWEATFNNRSLSAVRKKIKAGPDERSQDELIVTDIATGETLEGMELRSFTNLLTFHTQSKRQRTTVDTVWTTRGN